LLARNRRGICVAILSLACPHPRWTIIWFGGIFARILSASLDWDGRSDPNAVNGAGEPSCGRTIARSGLRFAGQSCRASSAGQTAGFKSSIEEATIREHSSTWGRALAPALAKHPLHNTSGNPRMEDRLCCRWLYYPHKTHPERFRGPHRPGISATFPASRA
jgi:hypothetical protein